MKKYFYRILNFFAPLPKPEYGEGIFIQRSWLEKQVQESLLKRNNL